MKTHEAKQLVLDSFTHAYDEQQFRKFIRNLFHDIQELNEGASSGSYIPRSFSAHIASYKRLAKFDDPEGMSVDVLAVKLRSASKLDNARTMQRNFIARYLNGSRNGELKDAALVAFYIDESDDWRFSLVRMDYVLDEEQQKIKKELTPARRYSFLVGASEGTHTAQQQLYPILQSDTETTLCELEDAFNIETITNEFFEKYKDLFLNLRESLDKIVENDLVIKQEFESKEIDTANFAKRLLGQLVFLYFLQKKGWLGVAKGLPLGKWPKAFSSRTFSGRYR